MAERKRIVVVDDEPDILQTIKTILQTKGYEIITANDGQTGIDLVRQTKPDLVIMDLMMPILSGLEACKIIRNDEELKDTPVIIISAIGKKSGKSEDFWKAGLKSDDFISKPFDPLNLLGRVEFLLRRNEYVSTRIEPKEPERPSVSDFKNLPPKDIVKLFIESWNTKDFDVEYTCLAPEMTGNLSMQNYVARRRQFYLDQNGDDQKQYFIKVVEAEEQGDAAQVICVREDMVKKFKQLKRQIFKLRKTADGWKIFSVAAHTQPVRNIE